MAGRSIEYNLPLGNGWQPISPANAIKAQMKFRANQRLTLRQRRNKNNHRVAVKAAERAKQIQEAHVAELASPITNANIAFKMRLNEKAAELARLQENYRARRAAQQQAAVDAADEIRRQSHVSSSAAAAAALLNAEGPNDEVNADEGAESAFLSPEIRDQQVLIYDLERASPVNSLRLEHAKAQLEVMEAHQLLERIIDEIPKLIDSGASSAMIADMYDSEERAQEAAIAASARLNALRNALPRPGHGGRRRKTRRRKQRR